MHASKQKCEGVSLARDGNKHEGGSQELIPYSIVQYLETLKCSQ